MTRTLLTCGLLALFVALPGCGSRRASVTGKVTYEDGTPVEAGSVIGEATVDGKLVAVQATIKKDGSFSWGGDREGDGALPDDESEHDLRRRAPRRHRGSCSMPPRGPSSTSGYHRA